ncbi:hypothetical protein [Stratiformator vulcanicus]|uniref:hypothetical protein n=1 Tax=Stratiformator vulcanicus TaxID=2527980 RepID=UPI002877984E|nr:hypothetical protein [Stratiformator vulcanicus]
MPGSIKGDQEIAHLDLEAIKEVGLRPNPDVDTGEVIEEYRETRRRLVALAIEEAGCEQAKRRIRATPATYRNCVRNNFGSSTRATSKTSPAPNAFRGAAA